MSVKRWLVEIDTDLVTKTGSVHWQDAETLSQVSGWHMVLPAGHPGPAVSVTPIDDEGGVVLGQGGVVVQGSLNATIPENIALGVPQPGD